MKLTVKLFINGVFPIYKPKGMTSATAVAKLKYILSNEANNEYQKEYKVGHGGTLDKGAEGVLVIGVDRGTKALDEYIKGNKIYVATGELGVTTDTLDSNGSVTDKKPFDHITRNDLISTLKSFEGHQSQVPPLYSALKIKGTRVSDLTRRGVMVDMKIKERSIIIHHINLKRFERPIFEIEASCSSGTYIRALIRDVAQRLDTVAYMTQLYRIGVGRFSLAEALRQEEWTYDNIIRLLIN